MSSDHKLLTLGGGCFWCIEAIFKRLAGVIDVSSGYSGGDLKTATYEIVSSGKSKHAEVCQIKFDPREISELEILRVFFQIHDPTTVNRQGNDVGPQYRSIIFYRNDEQKQLAEKIITELNTSKAFASPIVTELEQFDSFFEAEDYHQDYYENNSTRNTYCSLVIKPKIDKFEKVFKSFIRK